MRPRGAVASPATGLPSVCTCARVSGVAARDPVQAADAWCGRDALHRAAVHELDRARAQDHLPRLRQPLLLRRPRRLSQASQGARRLLLLHRHRHRCALLVPRARARRPLRRRRAGEERHLGQGQ
eukprot:1245460-Pleurochrysis_carterae.AAC.5